MSHTSRNFVVAYVLLLVCPCLGWRECSGSAAALVAPISVDGIWKICSVTAQLGSLAPAAKLCLSLSKTSVVISQSGKSLVLYLRQCLEAVASGTLDGKSI